MKIRTLLIANAVVFGASGIGAIVFPMRILLMYGVELSSSLSLMAQYAGLGSLVIALITWFLRNIKDVTTKKGICLALLICYTIGIVISVIGTISGIMDFGWVVVFLYSAFTMGYLLAYFNLIKTNLTH